MAHRAAFYAEITPGPSTLKVTQIPKVAPLSCVSGSSSTASQPGLTVKFVGYRLRQALRIKLTRTSLFSCGFSCYLPAAWLPAQGGLGCLPVPLCAYPVFLALPVGLC